MAAILANEPSSLRVEIGEINIFHHDITVCASVRSQSGDRGGGGRGTGGGSGVEEVVVSIASVAWCTRQKLQGVDSTQGFARYIHVVLREQQA